MNTLHGLPEWVAAVIEHWHGWVSGGVLGLFLEAGEKLWRWKPNRKVFAVIFTVGLLWSLFASWRDERDKVESLRSDQSQLLAKYNTCDKDRAVNDALAKSYQANLLSEQDLFNKCVLSLGTSNKPEPLNLKAEWVSQSLKSPDAKKYLAMIIGLTNQRVAVNIRVRCDKDFQYLDAKIAGINSLMNLGSKNTAPNEAIIDADIGGTWNPQHPLVVLVTTETLEPRACTITPR